MVAVLRVDASGCVIAANRAARAWLGEVVGARCCDAVLGRAGREVRCEPTCAGRLARGEGGPHVEPLVVRGRLCRVVCDRVGREVVVVVSVGPPTTTADPTLTPREREALGWVATGAETDEIARRMGVNPSTVRSHVEHAREKLGARTRAEAVARALVRGEIALPEGR